MKCLVGMNHDMVVMAKDRPPQKVREKDDTGKEYEEWIYGAPPQDVVFVRFTGDEVVQVKTAKIGGQIIVKTEKEVDIKDGVPTLAALKSSTSPQDVSGAPQPDQPKHKPTLKRPDEQPDPMVPQGTGQQGASVSRPDNNRHSRKSRSGAPRARNRLQALTSSRLTIRSRLQRATQATAALRKADVRGNGGLN